MAPCLAFAISNSFAPPSGKTLLLVGQDRRTIARYVRATRNTPGGMMFYTSIQKIQGLGKPSEYGSGPQDGKALLRSYPNSVIQVGLYMVGGLGDTIDGTYDANLTALAREHHKPFMIAESTPCGMYTIRGKVDWLNHIFHFVRTQNVEAFCYINSNWDVMPMFQGQHWGDARLEDHRETKDLWLKEIHQDRYLKSSPHLFQSLGWIHSNQGKADHETTLH